MFPALPMAEMLAMRLKHKAICLGSDQVHNRFVVARVGCAYPLEDGAMAECRRSSGLCHSVNRGIVDFGDRNVAK
jgi:hypothetical protein